MKTYIVLDGHENFLDGQRRGKGVLYLTGHIGAWELSSFAHALYGFPLHYMARPLDNARLDALVNRYRGLSGNAPIFKNESARAMLKILKDAGTVGILADQNTMPQEGVFVDFFGSPACTTTGIARVALHTGAAVVPGYAVWDAFLRKYRLRFEPPLELIRTGDAERDILENTQRFAKVIGRNHSQISRAVGLDSCAVEDAARGRAPAVRLPVTGGWCEIMRRKPG